LVSVAVLFVAAPIVAWVVGRFNALIVAGTRRAQERIADLSSNWWKCWPTNASSKRSGARISSAPGSRANERYFNAYMKVTQFNQTQAPVLATWSCSPLCASSRHRARGRSDAFRPSARSEFWGATALLINPMNRFSIFFADFARAFVGAGRVFEILDLPIERADPPDAQSCRPSSATCASSA
jgi:ABC-type multidrug transport system fused ATPase/permease subunit